MGLLPPVGHEAGHRDRADEPDDRHGHEQHQVVEVPVHGHVDAQRRPENGQQHVGCQHPVQQGRAAGNAHDRPRRGEGEHHGRDG
jgi:hypothetical protein